MRGQKIVGFITGSACALVLPPPPASANKQRTNQGFLWLSNVVCTLAARVGSYRHVRDFIMLFFHGNADGRCGAASGLISVWIECCGAAREREVIFVRVRVPVWYARVFVPWCTAARLARWSEVFMGFACARAVCACPWCLPTRVHR